MQEPWPKEELPKNQPPGLSWLDWRKGVHMAVMEGLCPFCAGEIVWIYATVFHCTNPNCEAGRPNSDGSTAYIALSGHLEAYANRLREAAEILTDSMSEFEKERCYVVGMSVHPAAKISVREMDSILQDRHNLQMQRQKRVADEWITDRVINGPMMQQECAYSFEPKPDFLSRYQWFGNPEDKPSWWDSKVRRMWQEEHGDEPFPDGL